ncbi:deoxyribose-phosphate aldolase [Actinotalea sp. M2MS4P-6]|uniref:Cgl0159 family (beta/alpha)8-fold protein n=1 Tax=Actinotalea sp. M2MS4P-6 TaxID=2983762 RepID=UPI0021E46C1E|nr:deoxyribose-phosphate aldolase [Actinotalea sp. M2MS4P-6]MCV2395025.1 deoxyribose-phosphate aldolase [Actinotalea sp. M2MS4P-6]
MGTGFVEDRAGLTEVRMTDPARIAARLAARTPFPGLAAGERLLIIAADHPARGALAAGHDAMAMADRWDLLSRVRVALARPGVHGFLGSADLVEDLTMLGALEGKLVLGSMNRGGVAGATFELDDRFTGYDPKGIAAAGLDGGKMLLRIDPDDPASVATLEACASAVDGLAERGLVAMIEPFWSTRSDGRVRNVLDAEAVIRSIAIASGLGRTSAFTWLKLPFVPDMARVLAATTLPTFVLGGDVPDGGAPLPDWAAALALPTVRGLTIGRSLLYPPDGDVVAAVDSAVALLGARPEGVMVR